MPKVANSEPYKKKYSEETLKKALEEIQNGASKKAVSKKYNVPRSTLQFRGSDKFSKTSYGPPPILTLPEEQLLVKWVSDSVKKGLPQRKEDIQTSVKNILDEHPRPTPFKHNFPGDGWYKSFLRRNPSLTERQPEAVTSARANVSENDIRGWFAKIETYLTEEHLLNILEDPKRIFNSDETNFQLCPKTKNVVAPRGSRNVYEVDRGQAKSNITVLFTFSAAGETTPPLIVYPYKRLPFEISTSVPRGWGIALSDNGWMKSHIFYEYIGNIFYKHLKQNNVTFPVILFVDGHTTHLTLQVSELCKQLNIILVALYPNATRILQPADVSAFKPLNTLWKKGVIDWRREHPTESLSREKLAPILESKCLGKKNVLPTNTSENNIVIEKTLNYEKFKQIMGQQKLGQFEAKHVIYEKNYSVYLYQIYNFFENQENYDYIDMSNQPTENVVQETPLKNSLDNNAEVVEINNLTIKVNTPHAADENILTFNIEDLPIDFAPAINEDVQQEVTTNFLQNNNTPLIKQYLTWPVTPQRKGNKNSEKVPFVLTSEQWQNIQMEKKRDKKRKEEEKEERKRKRSEQTIYKKTSAIKKKKIKNNEKMKIISDKKVRYDVTSLLQNKTKLDNTSTPQIENGISQHNSPDKEAEEITWTPYSLKECNKNNQKENTTCLETSPLPSSKNADEKPFHVKQIRFDEDEISDISSFENNQKVVSGLCFMCTFNITPKHNGIKCFSCGRIFHLTCLRKHFNMPPIVKTFICKAC